MEDTEEVNIHDDDFNLYYAADDDTDAVAKFAPPLEECVRRARVL